MKGKQFLLGYENSKFVGLLVSINRDTEKEMRN